ncbi:uncharacterized protein LOC130998513 [Salvia miltiorrhiza]|uniref:uncharacterized protein LOC130998513 n=1 Tax=Salvia miltiorrhiza TaxID=226208 RepID=UPI0025AD5DB9|nr:uncharacterized protein LOC130998513 [Salvia miltiorrhiza]
MAENPEVVNDNTNKTLRDMMFPNNLNLRSSAIVLPEITGNWELKHTLIQILPKYSDMPGEDSQRHLQDFEMACGTVRTASQALGEYIRLLTFPFSLLEGVREWLYDLPEGSIRTWQELQSKFLEKYFPAARIQNLRTRISNIKMGKFQALDTMATDEQIRALQEQLQQLLDAQAAKEAQNQPSIAEMFVPQYIYQEPPRVNFQQYEGEKLADTWERYQEKLRKCPSHGFDESTLVIMFYNACGERTRMHMDTAAGGSLLQKCSSEAWSIIESMAATSFQWPSERVQLKRVAAASSSDPMAVMVTQQAAIATQLAELTTKINALTIGNQEQAVRDPICIEDVNFVNGQNYENFQKVQPGMYNRGQQFQQQYQPGGRPHPNLAYNNPNNALQPPPGFSLQQYNNQGWRQHENLRYNNNNYLGPNQGQPSNQQQYSQQPQQARGSSLAELVHQMSQQQVKFQQETKKFMMETRGGMQNVNAHLSHLAQAVARLESKQGELPAQVEVKKVNAVTLRNGKELPEVVGKKTQEEPEVSEEVGMGSTDEEELAQEREIKKKAAEKGKEKLRHIEPIIPFPGRMAKEQEKEELTELVKIFRKVEVNMPLLVALRSMPRCAKFLKELCTRKVKYTDDAKFQVGESISAVLQRDMPIKCGDPGMFYIPCVIGTMKVDKAMLDLGASINVMLLSMYQDLEIGLRKPTRVVIQLADRSNVYPEGILEDVLVKVEELIFPADFYIFDMGKSKARDPVMLLGRPFLKTARTRIDCDTGKLTCQFEGATVTFDIYNAMKHPADTEMVNSVNIIDRVVEEELPRTTLREPLDVII